MGREPKAGPAGRHKKKGGSEKRGGRKTRELQKADPAQGGKSGSTQTGMQELGQLRGLTGVPFHERVQRGWGGVGEGAAAGALTTGAADKALGVVKAVQGLAGVALPVDAFVALDAGACEGRAGQWLAPPFLSTDLGTPSLLKCA